MKVKLVRRTRESAKPFEIHLRSFPITIGLPLEPHCEIDLINGRLLVRDLASEHGTFVNDVPIDVAPLFHGDKLTVGNASFVTHYEKSEESQHEEECSAKNAAKRELSNLRSFPALPRQSIPHVKLLDLIGALGQQRGHLPAPDQATLSRLEALFPDPVHAEHIEHMLVEELKQANVDPQFIYAFEQTGLLVTDFNYEAIPMSDLVAWMDAIDEYKSLRADEAEAIDSCGNRYPVGSITMYGPDRENTVLVIGSVFHDENMTQPTTKRWLGSSVRSDGNVMRQMAEFFLVHEVKSVICLRENVGCVHQEGIDYPAGQACPFCPYWRDKHSENPD